MQHLSGRNIHQSGVFEKVIHDDEALFQAMYELQVTTLEEVTFADQSQDHIDNFVVEYDENQSRKSPR